MIYLPAYTADNSPPSYDEVSEKLNSLVGSNPTIEKALEAANSLSDNEINVLANGYEDHYPLQTDQQKADFTVGAGQHLSSEAGQEHLSQAGVAASQAGVDINDRLIDIQQKLAVIDQSYHEGFADTLATIRSNYNDVLQGSRSLAADIAQNGQSFDTIIVPLSADSSVSVQDRKARVASFISDISKFESESDKVQQQFTQVRADFSDFVKTYSSWAENKEGELTELIKKLEQEISDLNDKLDSINAAQMAMAAIAGAAIPAATALGTVFEPLKPIFLIGGLITAAVALSASLGLIIAASRVRHEISQKTSEKEDLEEQLENIRNARQELQSMQLGGLESFQACMDVLPQYWKSTVQDAQSIHDWLDEGAGTEVRPVYMSLNVDKGVKSYNSTAGYLTKYAHGK
ncbi:hypothetical protein N8T08_007101 [Aspergillus melleus]|uniref:Uncharacterized protein n=1 Tax=Aspergillus melleus TaxID=138277 RepID=A0ACC3AZF9_9EURO|nr:hypothetical protein N8T08_007101 [Aspergillus melleus]